MTQRVIALAVLLTAATWCRPASGQLFGPPPAPDQIVVNATRVIEQLSAIPLQGIPASLLNDAQGVMICPNVIKAGFILGGRHGRGVLLIRTPSGQWSNPVFVELNGGSLGWQAGVESADVVLVFKTRRGVENLLQGGRFTLGGNASVAAGPIGRNAAAATDLQLQSEIYSYSRSRGLFAGVALDGTALRIDPSLNATYYQKFGITTQEITGEPRVPAPATTGQLLEVLARAGVARTAQTTTVPPPGPGF